MLSITQPRCFILGGEFSCAVLHNGVAGINFYGEVLPFSTYDLLIEKCKKIGINTTRETYASFPWFFLRRDFDHSGNTGTGDDVAFGVFIPLNPMVIRPTPARGFDIWNELNSGEGQVLMSFKDTELHILSKYVYNTASDPRRLHGHNGSSQVIWQGAWYLKL